jgi:hypothetical protein
MTSLQTIRSMCLPVRGWPGGFRRRGVSGGHGLEPSVCGLFVTRFPGSGCRGRSQERRRPTVNPLPIPSAFVRPGPLIAANHYGAAHARATHRWQPLGRVDQGRGLRLLCARSRTPQVTTKAHAMERAHEVRGESATAQSIVTRSHRLPTTSLRATSLSSRPPRVFTVRAITGSTHQSPSR